MYPIITAQIADLQILEMNTEKTQGPQETQVQQPPMSNQQPPMSNQQPPMFNQQPPVTSQQPPKANLQHSMTNQQPPPLTDHQLHLRQQEYLNQPQQEYLKQQEHLKQQELLKQRQQQRLQMQQIQQMQQLQRQQALFQQQNLMQFQPSPQVTHVDPAILYQQIDSPHLQTDISGINSHTNVDPAILFTQNAAQYQQNVYPQQYQQPAPATKSLDPAVLFQQQQQQQQAEPSIPAAQKLPFKDPAIISVTNKVEDKPKQPLFGGKKVKKPIKEIVVFEDYSEFESGKGVVKKVQPKKIESNASTPKKTKAKNEDKPNKPKPEGEKKPTRNTTPPVEVSKQSLIPASLIPPKARRSGSVTPQPQFTAKPVVVEPCRILTVSGGIQIPTVTSSQMEEAKQVASKCIFCVCVCVCMNTGNLW